jgi:hypothetical protein
MPHSDRQLGNTCRCSALSKTKNGDAIASVYKGQFGVARDISPSRFPAECRYSVTPTCAGLVVINKFSRVNYLQFNYSTDLTCINHHLLKLSLPMRIKL